MKILHVITSLMPGGAEMLVVNLLIRLKAMGNDCEIAVFNAVETPLMNVLKKNDITVHRFAKDGGSPYSPSNYLKLKRLISRGNFDIVHTHNTSAQLFAALCTKGKNTRFVTTEHNTDNRRRAWSWYRKIDQWMYRRYDRIICISDKTAENLISHIGTEFASKIDIVRNGVDIPKYKNDIRTVSKDGNIMLTMVAGFRDQKDQDTVVKAMALLPERFKLQFAGDGTRRTAVENLVKECNLQDRVSFLGMRSDIPEILRDTDITVLSSHYEGLSLASVEAMASGRPLVASDVPGLHEVVGNYGELFAEGDHVALSRILQHLGTDDEYYLAVAKRCQERSLQYDIDKTTEAYNNIYEKS